MPKLVRTIKFYTCKFKCGTKARPKNIMIEHEKNCFCNPENKSCRICKNCKSSSNIMECLKLNLHIVNLEKPHKVYNENGDVVWERKEPKDIFEFDEVCLHNASRPFPTKNCKHFVLGKKVY